MAKSLLKVELSLGIVKVALEIGVIGKIMDSFIPSYVFGFICFINAHIGFNRHF